MFFGNMMRQDIETVEIKSAKASKVTRGGAGESQLAIEKFQIKLRESKIQKELQENSKRVEHFRYKK